MEKNRQSRLLDAFLRGMASVFCLLPTYQPRFHITPLRPIHEVWQSDLMKIGGDFNKAIGRIDEQTNKET